MAQTVGTPVKIRASSGTSVTVNSAITYSAGSLAVAAIGAFQGTASTYAASDSVNGAYSMLTGQDAGDAGCRIGYKANISAGTVNLTVSGTSVNGLVGVFAEVPGSDTTAPFTVGEQAGGTGTSTAPDTGAVTNGTADSIYVGVVANMATNNPATLTINASGTEGTWVTDTTNAREVDGTTYMVMSMVWQIVASGAARSHTWTTGSFQWASAGAAFKAAAGGGGGATPIRRSRMTMMGVH
jgi:hypothetical protein